LSGSIASERSPRSVRGPLLFPCVAAPGHRFGVTGSLCRSRRKCSGEVKLVSRVLPAPNTKDSRFPHTPFALRYCLQICHLPYHPHHPSPTAAAIAAGGHPTVLLQLAAKPRLDQLEHEFQEGVRANLTIDAACQSLERQVGRGCSVGRPFLCGMGEGRDGNKCHAICKKAKLLSRHGLVLLPCQ